MGILINPNNIARKVAKRFFNTTLVNFSWVEEMVSVSCHIGLLRYGGRAARYCPWVSIPAGIPAKTACSLHYSPNNCIITKTPLLYERGVNVRAILFYWHESHSASSLGSIGQTLARKSCSSILGCSTLLILLLPMHQLILVLGSSNHLL